MMFVVAKVGLTFKSRDVTSASRLGQLGANSAQMPCPVMKLEDQFCAAIDIVHRFTAETVADLVDLTRA